MTHTVGNLIDRAFRDWLYPPTEQPIAVKLQGDITKDATTFTYDTSSLISPEEEDLIVSGVLLEIDYELMIPSTVTPLTNTVSDLSRGVGGTGATTHSAGSFIRIQPRYTRKSMLDAISSAISFLYPSVSSRRTTELTITSGYTVVPEEAEVAERFIYLDSGVPSISRCQIVDLPQSSTNKALISLDAPVGTTGNLIYRGRFTKPTYESQLLYDDLGVSEQHIEPIIVWAVAYLISGREIDTITSEYLTSQLEAQNVPPGRTSSISERLLRYYEYLLQQVRKTETTIITHHGWAT